MTQAEFLEKLHRELKRHNVPDTEDIGEEYRQHFCLRIADGFTQEEVAVKLGSPVALAAQFEGDAVSGFRKALTVSGLCVADVLAVGFFALLAAWEVVMAALCLGCAALSAFLLMGVYPPPIPVLPYWCGAVLGVSGAALSVLAAAGGIYFWAFLRQLARCWRRFHDNALASAGARPTLPSLSARPRLTAKMNRRLRTTALFAAALFAAATVLGLTACMVSSGAVEFWHVWGWFGASAR